MQTFPYAERNKVHIWNVLRNVLNVEQGGSVLEIGSGTGQHAAFFASQLGAGWSWTPSDLTEEKKASVEAHAALANVADRVKAFETIDAARLGDWARAHGAEGSFDVLFNANVIHISPPEVFEGLIRGAALALRPGGRLVFYGPFARDGSLTPGSNVKFEEFLKAKDPRFGVRDLERDLIPIAEECSLDFEKAHDVPSNNFVMVFRKIKSNNH